MSESSREGEYENLVGQPNAVTAALLDTLKEIQADSGLARWEELRNAVTSDTAISKALGELSRTRIDPRLFANPLSEVAKQLTSPNASIDKWGEELRGLTESLKHIRQKSWLTEISSGLKGLSTTHCEFEDVLSVNLKSAMDRLVPTASSMAALSKRLWAPAFDFEAYEERERRSLVIAANEGWFIQPECPASLSVRIEKCSEDPKLLCELFLGVLAIDSDAIESRLKSNFPSLAHIVEEAFNLHKEERYIGSVPLFLICADGISKIQTGKSVYTNASKRDGDNRKPIQVAEHVRKFDINAGMSACFEVLCTQHALSSNRNGPLNRHTVLHGENANYHSIENSFRALSFLGFVGWLLAPDAGHLSPRIDVA